MADSYDSLRASDPRIRKLDDNLLIKEAFKQAAWGLDNLERDRIMEEIEKEVRYRSLNNLGFASIVADSVKNGQIAHLLARKYQNKLHKEGNSEQVQNWLERETVNRHDSIKYHLNICLEKWQSYQERVRTRSGRPLRIDIPPIHLNEHGVHPNSLRALAPAAEWDVLIDESGLYFDQKSLDNNVSSNQIGRFVAIAIPNNKQLPPLKVDQHAAGSDTEKLQQIVNNLLQSKIGVFGFAADDPVFDYRSYWMSHIHNLMRWVLVLLPIEAGAECQVRFRIEQRGGYIPDTDLTALREVLENEIKRLNPQHYAELKLDLAIIDKRGHPANGYVDAIANLWGSPSDFKNKLLQHTHLLSHCLLNPKHHSSLERLYMSLTHQRTLQPEAWYNACAAQVLEGKHSLLHAYLERLGVQCQDEVDLWSRYLGYVSRLLGSKRYRLAELGQALEWLEQYRPAEKKLPVPLELQLLAARLSLVNHQGVTQPGYLVRSFELARQLEEENAPLACETMLRLAISATNAFQFEQVQPMIEHWLDLPVATPGLLNHGKVHSTQGQLLAFQGKNEQAISHFEQAFSAFERLSDPLQADKERLQTSGYHLCALMDLEDLSGSERMQDALCAYLQQVTGKSDLPSQVVKLARSGDVQSCKFAHHLLLRALISWPQTLQPLRDQYLSLQADWQDGLSHPWPLIQFYRGWLCLDAGESEMAAEMMEHAISLCEQPDNGPTLHWMGAVLRQLAISLNVPGLELDTEKCDILKQQLPLAPHPILAQTPTVPLSWLRQVLPFNFH
ncbi:hypothetical protein P0F03_003070 [Vibrio metschnikovii]|nr:hypothetical protein [Vibrio metschnikovii]EKO3733194.1 hypothetical protein [Vibrio metschnikovii]